MPYYFKRPKLGVVAHTYNSSTKEAEAGISRVQDQPSLHSETLNNKTKTRQGSGSSSRVPAYQVLGSKFKPCCGQNKTVQKLSLPVPTVSHLSSCKGTIINHCYQFQGI
jgi:hypothetical protein